jgi:TetR/AcrR family transcriptional regulator, lmrAB and yxaGH operons repressor
MTSVTEPRIGTNERILRAAAELFRRQGYAATGIKSILEASHTPYGSLYHFFPGGKQEVAVAVIEAQGATYRELVESSFPPDADVVEATIEFFSGGADLVEQTDFADACPIATLALEVASTDEPMRRAAAAAFESWLSVLTARFVAAGIAGDRAYELAVEMFCLIEGAFLLARTTRSGDPLRTAGAAAADSIRQSLAGRRRKTSRSR